MSNKKVILSIEKIKEFDYNRISLVLASPKKCAGQAVWVNVDNDPMTRLYINCPERNIPGFYKTYNYSVDNDRSNDAFKGYTMQYPLTSKETADNPTRDEQSMFLLLDNIWLRFCQCFIEFYNDPSSRDKFPDSLKRELKRLSVAGVTEENLEEWEDIIKPLYSKERKPVKEGGDQYHPINIFVPVQGKKVEDTFKVEAQLLKWGTNIAINPADYASDPMDKSQNKVRVSGTCWPVISVSSLYVGQHGNKTWQVSTRLKLTDCWYKSCPISSGTSNFFDSMATKSKKKDDNSDSDDTESDDSESENSDSESDSEVATKKSKTKTFSPSLLDRKSKKKEESSDSDSDNKKSNDQDADRKKHKKVFSIPVTKEAKTSGIENVIDRLSFSSKDGTKKKIRKGNL